MPSDLDIEILTIDDSAPAVKTVTKNILKKKLRTVRKSTGVGGKVAHRTIPFKPLRKSLPVKPNTPRKTRNENPEYFDVEDDESDDDDIQVIESDPLFDVEVLDDGQSEGFCDMCGLYLENTKDMENHHETAHSLVTCKWCQTRLATTDIKKHIGEKLCANFTKLLGSHCSVHNEIETDDQLELESTKNCRPLSCDACAQRYDIKSLREFDSKNKSFICPGCLHGRIDASKDKSAEAAHLESIASASSNDEKKSSPVKPKPATLPIPHFLELPNPVPLPDILLLDDDEVDIMTTEESAKCEKNETPQESETVEESSLKSPLKKKSNTNLTSKLVEMINTELQEKDSVKDVHTKVTGKDLEEDNITNTEDQKNVENAESPSEIEILEISDNELVVGSSSNETDASIQEDPEVLDIFEVENELPAEKEVGNISEIVKEKEDITVIDTKVVDVLDNACDNEIEMDSTNDQEILVVDDVDAGKSVNEESSKNVPNVVDSINVVSKETSSSSPCKSLTVSPLPISAALPAATSVRRVARKSTRPPVNPQRFDAAELLLFETSGVQSPSPKRKLESPVSSARKVARKSTRPPANPQRTLFNEETTSPDNNPDGVEMDTSLLLESPEKDGLNVMDDLEVLDEIV